MSNDNRKTDQSMGAAACSAGGCVTVGQVRAAIAVLPDEAQVVVMGSPCLRIAFIETHDGDLELYPQIGGKEIDSISAYDKVG